MKLSKSILILFTIISSITFVIVLLNYEYFQYLSNTNKSYNSQFSTIATFVGGDSRFYYNMSDNIIEVIYIGVLDGGVEFGSILSLIGIYLYVSLSEILFGNVVIGVLALNTIIILLMATTLHKNHVKNIHYIFIFFPMTLNYMIVPNKEIFGILILVLLSFGRKKLKFNFAFIFTVFRDSYLVIFISSKLLKFFNFKTMLVFFSIILPLVIPETYFKESDLVSGQKSSFITNIANTLLGYPLLSLLGVLVKILLGLYSGLMLTSLDLNIVKIQYFLCSIINLVFLYYFLFKRSFRRMLLDNNGYHLKIYTLFGYFMCLAPGNPARFLAPLSFIFLVHLLNKHNGKFDAA